MSGLIPSAKDRAYFPRMPRRQLNSAVHRRMNVLLLLDDGRQPRWIAEAFDVDEGTVAARRRRDEAAGRAGIEQLDYHRRTSALNEARAKRRFPLTSMRMSH